MAIVGDNQKSRTRMCLLKLVAEGVGPFERIDIDFSDGQGYPHLGPHILAGVNGSGKSTVLRTIAWVFNYTDSGFDNQEWKYSLSGYGHSRAYAILRHPGGDPYITGCSWPRGIDSERPLSEWLMAEALSFGLPEPNLSKPPFARPRFSRTVVPPVAPRDITVRRRVETGEKVFGYSNSPSHKKYNIAAYSPANSLKYIANPDLNKVLLDGSRNALAFEGTVQNEPIQAWLLSLYSKRAIARERHQTIAEYTRSLDQFERALKLMYGTDIRLDVQIEPAFEPRLVICGRSFNFSQLADGVRGTVGWISDFMMRQDGIKWDPLLNGVRPGILLLDEVDVHLHPLWQRRLLPAMREGLKDVQMIVTSHSPFVISSCPGARIHVLQIGADGHSHNCPPVDSPIGESVLTTLKEIFGVKSRFDVQTELELDEWNNLKRKEIAGTLSPEQENRLFELTQTLSSRSEELRSLVGAPLQVPEKVLQRLLEIGAADDHPPTENVDPIPRPR